LVTPWSLQPRTDHQAEAQRWGERQERDWNVCAHRYKRWKISTRKILLQRRAVDCPGYTANVAKPVEQLSYVPSEIVGVRRSKA
jgi:hypothetical protein